VKEPPVSTRLPDGFEALEPFLAYWDVPSSALRMKRRSEASMADIRAFYDAMTPRGEEILNHLERFEMQALPEREARLFRLLLALAQAAMAVEMHGQPRVPFSPYPHAVTILKPPQPYGG
jgi:hypothetical protein